MQRFAQHPQIFTSPIKEPKYYMGWDAPPPAYTGPGDETTTRRCSNKLPKAPYDWKARRSICTRPAQDRRGASRGVFVFAIGSCVSTEGDARPRRGVSGRRPRSDDRNPADNARPFVERGLRTSALGRVIRAAAATASHAPPQVWRTASKPLVSLLQHGGPTQGPKLTPEQRTALLGDCIDDIAVLEQTLGQSFEDWRSAAGRGSFAERKQAAQ